MPYNNRLHSRRQIRLPGYDYSKPGYYFFTTVVHNRQCILGEVLDNTVHLSVPGEITLMSWFDLARHYPATSLDAYCVMPNHFHGLIQLLEGNEAQLPHIVGSFKKYSAKRINIHLQSPGISFWQRGFYEHITRNAPELDRIRKYIRNNPSEWKTDQEHPKKSGN
jgi:putative transposase